MDISSVCAVLRKASRELALHTAAQKNKALENVAVSLEKNSKSILEANRIDIVRAVEGGMAEALVDRLRLTETRIAGMLSGLRTIADLPDPIGEVAAGWQTPNGLAIRQVRVPIGVAAIIYESRPLVTVDAFALSYKSGNALLLRGSSNALESNKALFAAVRSGLETVPGLPDAVALLDSGERSEVDAVLNARGLIDVVLPRGGAALIKMVSENSRVPVIETGSGVCHLFVDESADLGMALNIVENGKLQRPGVCNALETLVVHRAVMDKLLPALEKRFAGRCELRYDEAAFGVEFLDTVLAVKTVADVDEAIAFINAHNTKHSESIVTRSIENARKFQERIDAACVYVNASTRFTDGGEFGFGAELGISTQKLHVRGPMGLHALTTTKYLIDGAGQVR
jgi:glutamate-5-semialdehyde dehydrogenase